MYLQKQSRVEFDSNIDFRIRASLWVSLVSIFLLLPVSITGFVLGDKVVGTGTFGVMLLFATVIWLIRRDQNHQSFTLFVLVPAGFLYLTELSPVNGFSTILWFYPSIVGVYCLLSERRAWLANAGILVFSLPFLMTLQQAQNVIWMAVTLLAVSFFSAISIRVVDSLSQELQYHAMRDPMTGLLNRVMLKSILDRSIAQHEKSGAPASLLALDIDFFKSINDKYGHDAGDRVLTVFAEILNSHLRNGDVAFRTGGEEFVVLINGCDEKHANCRAEHIRRAIEVAEILDSQAVTVSIGVAEYDFGESYTQWLKRADNNMYAAKNMGRNRVSLTKIPVLTRHHLRDFNPARPAIGTDG